MFRSFNDHHQLLTHLQDRLNKYKRWRINLKRDTIENFEKNNVNCKMRETWNNTCAGTALNTRKKIVKNRNYYNDYNTNC